MTQNKDDKNKILELNALFTALDDKGQDNALTILRSLSFAQSVTSSPQKLEQTLELSDDCSIHKKE